MKKDRITRNKSGWIIIRCNGEEKSLIEWLQDPRVSISGTQLRRRVREVEAGAMHMTVERLLFQPVSRGGCKARQEPKPKAARGEPSEDVLWQRRCTRVLCSKVMTL